MSNNTDYTVERLTENNLEDIAKLYAAVYGKPSAKDLFVKKYATAYTGKQYIGFIAYNNERVPVGYYGVIPCFLQYDNDIILSAQSADTMTHPQFRFKGLFVELSNKTFDLCRNEGIRLVFGFPNQNSLHGAINKLGWKMTDTMDCFIIPVKAIPLERMAAKFSLLKPLYRKYKKQILKKYEEPVRGIPNPVIAEGYSGVYRDANYLAYKTYHDHQVIRIRRSLVWIKISSAIIIGDMVVSPDDFDNVMDEIKKIAARLGINQIQFQTSPNTNLHSLFIKRYQPVPSFPVLFQDLDSDLSLNKFKFSFADIDIF